jgi:beta-glucosidase
VAAVSRLAEANAAGYCVPNQAPDHVDTDLGASSLRRPGVDATEMGWEVEPGALQELLVRVNDEYARLPIYVTENGAACNDYVAPNGDVHDPDRIRYLRGHLQAVLDGIEAGVDVRGYFVWSFLDNFEWAHGFSRRFGLTWVDFASGARIPKSSFAWYRDVVAANALLPAGGGGD